MSNILFIVCPFSVMENTLKRQFGSNSYFLSCPGAIIPYNDQSFIDVMKESIIINNVTSIYLVNDRSCSIINNVILHQTLHGLEAEYLIQSLYVEAYKKAFIGRSLFYQQFRLAELNVQFQKNEILTNGVFTNLILDEKITVKSLVTDKALRIFKESRVSSFVKTTYEL